MIIRIEIITHFPKDWVKKFIYERLKHYKVFVGSITIVDDKGEITEVKKKYTKLEKLHEGNRKYPFREMKVGDELEYDKKYSRENMSRAFNNANSFRYNSNDCKHYRFSTRKVDDKIIIRRIK